MESLKRKFNHFILVVGVVLLCALTSPVTCRAESLTLLTPDLARQMAEEFARDVDGGVSRHACDPIKIYGDNGRAIGYSIDFRKDGGEAAGYVIFDNSQEDLISEYSLSDGAASPVDRLGQASVLLESDGGYDGKVVKTSPFDYGLYSEEKNEITDGLETEAYSFGDESETPSTGSWDDVFINTGTGGYGISYMKTIPEFISISEDQVEASAKRYACAVSAMLNCSVFYCNLPSRFDKVKNEYDELWSLSDTAEDKTTGGITYGSTLNSKIGPAFTTYCSRHGKAVTYTYADNPTFNAFSARTDHNNMSIVCLGINKNGKRSGHAMAVEGYGQMTNGTKKMNMLVVADGWYGSPRYLNYAYANYTDKAGVFFFGE